jgi:murein DD-endopeptidase MepM/ murein hydrolase activator NlpD
MDLKTAFAVAIGGLSLVVGQTAGPTLAVSAAARSLQPGELVVLTVTADAPVDAITATAFGHDLTPDPVDARTWRFMVGIDLDVTPGPYQVAVTARSGSRSIGVQHPLTVEPKAFRTRTLTVDEGFVNPPAAVRPRIADEAARLEQCWRESSTSRLWSGPFVRPVDHASNSAFGTRSIFNGQARSAHGGADFLSPAGTPVLAANSGRVMLADQLYYSGGTVVIDHGLGVVSLYAHLSAIDARAGDTVSAAQVVGRVGATGRVTGAHLHWTVRISGARVDPLSLLAMLGTPTRKVPGP